MKAFVMLMLCGVAMGSIVTAQQTRTQDNTNAALRYWMAFALMSDSPASEAASAKLDAILAGNQPWDERQFGEIIERNKAALKTMIRGTKLKDCNWGIEYDLGPNAPIAQLPKARILARLNVLYAKRLAAAQDTDGAVEALSAGIRFAHHLSQNESFLGALTAKAALAADLAALKQLAQNGGRLSSSNLRVLRTSLTMLPPGGLDWASAARVESDADRIALEEMIHSAKPRALYASWFGTAPPKDFQMPTAKDVTELAELMNIYAQMLGAPSDATQSQLSSWEKRKEKLNSVIRMLVPSFSRIAAARAELSASLSEVEGILQSR